MNFISTLLMPLPARPAKGSPMSGETSASAHATPIADRRSRRSCATIARVPIENPVVLRLMERIRSQVDPDFDFLSPGPSPWTTPSIPARETRVALITTAGLHRKGDAPFRALEEPLGDTSYRIISSSTPAHELDLTAAYVDPRHIPEDPEVALPLQALEALHQEGVIGSLAPRHASF